MHFSYRQRDLHLRALREQAFDLLVVGGGITGAGIAHDAARRGLRVALVERDDFASGTSSRSSKLIHGGLRYLEQGDVGLVFEAVRERQRLMQLAPHLAVPQSFVVPVFPHSRRGVFMLDLGLTIYDTLAAFSGVLRHRAMRRSALLQVEPLLQPAVQGGVRYFDAQTDDARLVLANIRAAVAAGATCVSRATLVRPLRNTDGRLQGGEVIDERSGATIEVHAQAMIAAAGPFTDEIRSRLWGAAAGPARIRPSKGVHVVVPRARLPLSEAIVMTAADGRVVFALPWAHTSVIGTTDTAFDGDLRAPTTSVADADYLLATANATLAARGGPLRRDDIVSTWAGIRPLAIGTRDDTGGTYQSSREHTIDVDPQGIVTIAGGKLTTYRLMAAQAVDAALPLLLPTRRDGVRACDTDTARLPGATTLPAGPAALDVYARTLVDEGVAPEPLAHHLARIYGDDARSILALMRDSADGGAPVLRGLPTRWAELDWSMDHEMPLDLVDLVVRRSGLYYNAGGRVLEVAEAIAARMCARLGWPADAVPGLVDGLQRHVAAGVVGADEVRRAA